MPEQPEYNEGGLLAPGTTWVRIHPDECLISAEDVRNRRLVCSRAGHPIPTSDCHRD